jgi:hypothetical protein
MTVRNPCVFHALIVQAKEIVVVAVDHSPGCECERNVVCVVGPEQAGVGSRCHIDAGRRSPSATAESTCSFR